MDDILNNANVRILREISPNYQLTKIIFLKHNNSFHFKDENVVPMWNIKSKFNCCQRASLIFSKNIYPLKHERTLCIIKKKRKSWREFWFAYCQLEAASYQIYLKDEPLPPDCTDTKCFSLHWTSKHGQHSHCISFQCLTHHNGNDKWGVIIYLPPEKISKHITLQFNVIHVSHQSLWVLWYLKIHLSRAFPSCSWWQALVVFHHLQWNRSIHNR